MKKKVRKKGRVRFVVRRRRLLLRTAKVVVFYRKGEKGGMMGGMSKKGGRDGRDERERGIARDEPRRSSEQSGGRRTFSRVVVVIDCVIHCLAFTAQHRTHRMSIFGHPSQALHARIPPARMIRPARRKGKARTDSRAPTFALFPRQNSGPGGARRTGDPLTVSADRKIAATVRAKPPPKKTKSARKSAPLLRFFECALFFPPKFHRDQ